MTGSLTPGAVAVLAGMFGALALGSIIRLTGLRADTTEAARSQRSSLATWWALAVLMTVAVGVGPGGVCVLLGAASWMAFSEYRTLEAADDADRFAFGLLRLTIPAVYLAVYVGLGLTALALLPVMAVLLVATSEIVHGVTRGYVRSIGAQVFGAVVLIGGPAHAAQVVAAPGLDNPVGGVSGWFIYLVLLTEINDIAQALVGRRLGSSPMTVVSPAKTWEGFVGGACVTAMAAVLLAPWLTPLVAPPVMLASGPVWLLPWGWPLLAGLLIAVAGLLGDLNISAVKRDADVKDSSHALPGMGGVLDRVDSLTLTAPVFHWLVVVPAT